MPAEQQAVVPSELQHPVSGRKVVFAGRNFHHVPLEFVCWQHEPTLFGHQPGVSCIARQVVLNRGAAEDNALSCGVLPQAIAQ
jgi:hypothetical protein